MAVLRPCHTKWISLLLGCLGSCGLATAGEEPDIPSDRPLSTPRTASIGRSDARDAAERHLFWQRTPVAGGAVLVTLFQQADANGSDLASPAAHEEATPLVAILCDTLGDRNPANDQVRDVWSLTAYRPGILQRVLSGVPFLYWRLPGHAQRPVPSVASPLVDLQAPLRGLLPGLGRRMLQWNLLDTAGGPLRASSRSYQNNVAALERMEIEQTISLLRHAPADAPAPTRQQLAAVMARLSLSKNLFGGFVGGSRLGGLHRAGALALAEAQDRNWESLRLAAERTGLVFEALPLGDAPGQYAMVSLPLAATTPGPGSATAWSWRVLGIANAWHNRRVRNGEVWSCLRYRDNNGQLLPPGNEGARPEQLVPLAVYNLSYPKRPLVMIDFQHAFAPRRREMMQRGVADVATGLLGLSHFANWYFFAGNAFYEFYTAHQGRAVDAAARLDCYAQFRAALAVDTRLESGFRRLLQERLGALALNPLEGSPELGVQQATERYRLLLAYASAPDGMSARLARDRRAELAATGQAYPGRGRQRLLRALSAGLYRLRAPASPDVASALDRYRRLNGDLWSLQQLANAPGPPEVLRNGRQIQSLIREAGGLVRQTGLPAPRAQYERLLDHFQSVSQDADIRADCVAARAGLTGALPPPELTAGGSEPGPSTLVEQ